MSMATLYKPNYDGLRSPCPGGILTVSSHVKVGSLSPTPRASQFQYLTPIPALTGMLDPFLNVKDLIVGIIAWGVPVFQYCWLAATCSQDAS